VQHLRDRTALLSRYREISCQTSGYFTAVLPRSSFPPFVCSRGVPSSPPPRPAAAERKYGSELDSKFNIRSAAIRGRTFTGYKLSRTGRVGLILISTLSPSSSTQRYFRGFCFPAALCNARKTRSQRSSFRSAETAMRSSANDRMRL